MLKEYRDTHVMTIHVLGPFNSGTNLVQKIVGWNDEKTCSFWKKFWKHCFQKDVVEKVIRFHRNDLFIFMYRDLYSWIPSVLKTPYDISFLSDKKWKGPLTISTDKKCRALFQKYFSGSENLPSVITFSNLVELFNHYYTMYRDLAKKYPSRVIILNYSKIIQPEGTQYIKSKLDPFLDISHENIEQVLSEPSKTHGKPVQNVSEAQAKYAENISLYSNILKTDPALYAFVDPFLDTFYQAQ